MLTFLGLDYRETFCCPRNPYSKKQINQIIITHKNLILKELEINMFKMDLWTFW